METKIEKLSGSEVELIIEISALEFDAFTQKAISLLSEKMEFPGFRKGNAPKEFVIQKAGMDIVLSDAAKIAVEQSYRKAILEQKLEPISQPKVEILKIALKNPFSFKARFFILPKIDLPDYKGIALKVPVGKISISKKEMDSALEWVQRSRADFKQVERPAKKHDFVEIEFYSPEIEGNKKQEDAFILNKGHLVPGFEKHLESMSAGEEKDFPIDFASNFGNKGLAGKKVNFHVKMISVKEVELPVLNDDFAKKIGKFENLDDLKKNIEQGIKTEKENVEKQKREIGILEAIEKKCKIDIPDILIETEKQKRIKDLKENVSRKLHVSFEDYLKKVKKTEKELNDIFRKESGISAKRFLILREIAKQENIEVSQEEVNNEISKTLSQYPDAEQAEKNIDSVRLKNYTEEMLRNKKVLEVLRKLK